MKEKKEGIKVERTEKGRNKGEKRQKGRNKGERNGGRKKEMDMLNGKVKETSVTGFLTAHKVKVEVAIAQCSRAEQT